MTISKNVFNNLDTILGELGKKTGIYQIKNYIFIIIPIIYGAMFSLSYVFTARNLDYRCHIPECDSPNPVYNTPWLKNAVPFSIDNIPSRCDRYKPVETNHTSYMCPASIFSNSSIERCNEYVFDTNSVTILNDFGLMCDENLWKLTLIGTINNLGQFVGLPISGFISDKFGRRFLMLGGLLISASLGLARSFSPNYYWFAALEFLDPLASAGSYSSGFILGVEQVSPEKRVLSGSIVSSAYAMGESIVGIVAWNTPNWRWFLRCLYLPGVFIIALYWLTPESLRWMLSKGKNDEAKEILKRAAKLNNVNISEESFSGLDFVASKQEEDIKYPFRDIFKSKKLLLRLVNCSFCWITCAFVFYGLSLNSVAIAGNIYLNFIFVALIEIPGYFTTYLILDRFGRRYSLCGSLLLSGIACLAFIFIPENITWMKLTAFLVGKFGITISFTVLYVFTTELFPTPLRHSLLGTCSMFGRIGSMVAPQTPLLAEVMKILPLLLFAGMSISSGLLILICPETLNTKLPDTIEEAENIGIEDKKEKLQPSV